MIADSELRKLFQAESSDHIQALEAGLLALEQGDAGAQNLEGMLREAHSLKGAARMLEQHDIEVLMHAIEDGFRSRTRSGEALNKEQIDAIYHAIDDVKLLVNEALGGEHATIDLGETIAALKNEPHRSEQRPAAPADPPHPAPVSAVQPGRVAASRPASADNTAQATEPLGLPREPTASHQAQAQSEAQPETESETLSGPEAAAHDAPSPVDSTSRKRPAAEQSPYHIDTVRVATDQLDRLMSQASEVLVTRQYLLHDSEQFKGLYEDFDSLLGRLRREAPEADWLPDLEHYQRRQVQLRDRLRANANRFDSLANGLADEVRAARLMPVSALFKLFPRNIRDIAHSENKDVALSFQGGDTLVDKHVIEVLKAPLMHVLRNAVHHGIEAPDQRQAAGKPRRGEILVSAVRRADTIIIEVADDGRGLDRDAIRERAVKQQLLTQQEAHELEERELFALILRPGFTTERVITDVSGRGVGLDVAQHALQELKGGIRINSAPGIGTRMRLSVPVSITTTRLLLVRSGEQRLGLPMQSVLSLHRHRPESAYHLEGRAVVDVESRALPLVRLADLLDQQQSQVLEQSGDDFCVVVEHQGDQAAVLIEELLGEEEVLLKPFGGVVQHLTLIAGAAILSNGVICPVLNPDALVECSWQEGMETSPEATQAVPKMVLLVEDSMITRVQEKRMLESADYQVVTAVNGEDALEKLQNQAVDAIVSDINMPRMSGLELTRHLRSQPRYRDLPVVLVTTLETDEDKRRGMEAGANAYITKHGFDDSMLLSTLERLV